MSDAPSEALGEVVHCPSLARVPVAHAVAEDERRALALQSWGAGRYGQVQCWYGIGTAVDRAGQCAVPRSCLHASRLPRGLSHTRLSIRVPTRL